MKVKALSRSKFSTQRECVGDLRKQSRNLDPVYHPMQRPRQMARAVTSAKMERMISYCLICLTLPDDFYLRIFWTLKVVVVVASIAATLPSLQNHWWGILVTVIKMLSTIPQYHESRCCRCFRDVPMGLFLCGIYRRGRAYQH